MPTIDFYLLNTANKEDVYRFLCRLVDKAYQHQHNAYIHTNTLEEAQHLDDLLWTFRDISFIPHQIGTPNPTQLPTLVTLGIEKPKQYTADILFNLSQEAPPFFLEFARVIEVVSEEKNHKNQARKKYKFYKEQNCQLTTHPISLPC